MRGALKNHKDILDPFLCKKPFQNEEKRRKRDALSSDAATLVSSH